MNKLILIEGTDCSGKETQTKLLVEKLKTLNINSNRVSYPNYESPTGKIVGGAYIGKDGFMPCVFEQNEKVDPKVAALYYLADRKYNAPKLNKLLDSGHVILDRYVESNMAFQGGLLPTKEERNKLYEFLYNLEYSLYELKQPDLKILLYMPLEYGTILRNKRNSYEKLDKIESNNSHLLMAENAYLELAEKYNFKIINCVHNNEIRTIEDINEELEKLVYEYLNN